MVVGMQKKILSILDLYYGDVAMPKGFGINRPKLQEDILKSSIHNKSFPFSRTQDMLMTYLREHIAIKYNFNLIPKKTWGQFYKDDEISIPLRNIDPVDLRNSPDYTCLYGVNVDQCKVRIYYDDNRRKGRSWDVELKNNMFIMFPSTLLYCISNKQKEKLNFILTTTYESI